MNKPLTDADIVRLKAQNLKEFPDHAGYATPDGKVYLCEDCPIRHSCPFSMDPYNTVGDYCLADK